MKKVHLRDAVYGGEIHILVGASDANVKSTMAKIAPRWKGGEAGYDGVGCTWEFGLKDGADGNTFLVAMKGSKMTPYGISVLAHELFHVTHQLLDNAGMRLNDETVEAYCYFFDSLLRDALKALEK